MKKILLSCISAFLLTTSIAYSEEESFDLEIRGQKKSFTQKSFGEAIEVKNMLNAFGGLTWAEGNLENITKVLFDAGAKKVEVYSGGCLSRTSSTLFSGLLNAESPDKLLNKTLEDFKKPCSIILTKSIPINSLIEKISSSDKKFIKINQELTKSMHRHYFPMIQENTNMYETILDFNDNKNKKLLNLGNNLEIQAEPIIISGLPFKAVFSLSMNAIFFTKAKEKYNLKLFTDKSGSSYPYLIKNITLESISEHKSKEEVKDKMNLIYESLKEKYPNFFVPSDKPNEKPSIGYFTDAINNTIYLTGDPKDSRIYVTKTALISETHYKQINYSSGFFDLGSIFYAAVKQNIEKSKENDLYKNQKDSTNKL